MRSSPTRPVSMMLPFSPIKRFMVLVLISTCLAFLIFLFFQSRHVEIECVIRVISHVKVWLLSSAHDSSTPKSTNCVVAIQANGVVVLHGWLSLLCVTLLEVIVGHHFEIFANFACAEVASEVNIVHVPINFCSFVIIRPIAEYTIRRLVLHLIISNF